MGRREIKPLDPNSPDGIYVAERMSEALAVVQLSIWRREAEAELAAELAAETSEVT